MVAGTEKRRWLAGTINVLAIAFSPDGKTLASEAYWESIRLWDVATGRERHPSEEHLGSIDLVRFAPDGASLVSISCDQRMLWWDMATRTPVRHFSWSNEGPNEMLSLIALSPDGNTLAVRHRPGDEWGLWDTRTGKQRRPLGKHQNKISEIAFSPDGRLVASAEDEHVIHVWDVRDGKEVRQMKGFTSHAMKLCFSPDGKALACGRWEGGKPSLRLRDVASGKDRCVFQCVDPIGSLAFSPEGKVLATGTINRPGDSLIRLWDTVSGKELVRHKGQPDPIQAIAFSPDGKLVASGAGFIRDWHNSLHVWEAATGRLIRCFEGHHGFVTSVAFSPDGLTMASGGSDSTILLWDITGRRTDGRWHGKPLTPRQLDVCWTALANEDAAKAYHAVWTLAAVPEQAVPFLRKHLPPISRPDPQAVARWLADLDNDEFAVRQKANDALTKLGDAITPALCSALQGKPSLEVRRRLRQLLDQPRDWTPERLRVHRAIQALEHIGTPAARELLQALAEGAPEAGRTEEAKAALKFLTKNP